MFPSGTVPFVKHFSATAQAETSSRELRAYAVLVFTAAPAAWLPGCCSSSFQPPKAHAYARSTEVSRIDSPAFAVGAPGIVESFTLAAITGAGHVESVSDTVTFDVPFHFGLPFEIASRLDVLVVAGGNYEDAGLFVSGFGEADSLDTARIAAVQVLDGSANPVANYTATTGSGVPFPAAPEPSAVALMSASGLTLAAIRRARARRTKAPHRATREPAAEE